MISEEESLERFVLVQEHSYSQVLAEIKNGQKNSHWMWYIFPQIEGLGSSPAAQKYSIKNKNEAVSYLKHSVLGPRLKECTNAVLSIENKSVKLIFGYPDVLKLCSSMTLFESIAGEGFEFSEVIEKFYAGERDVKTLEILDNIT